nr:hypothetical protein [Akkermansiaceae bacterium]
PDSAETLGASLADGTFQPQGITGILSAITAAPGVETKHLHREDTVFSRMMWTAEAHDAIGEAVKTSGMLYFQQIMGGPAAIPGNPGD